MVGSILAFKAVQGNVHLVQTLIQKRISTGGEQRAVGGEHGAEACLPCHFDEAGQKRVDKRLAHEVVVDIFCFALQLLQQMGILRLRHLMQRALMPVAEGAVHIADVGDLHIDP